MRRLITLGFFGPPGLSPDSLYISDVVKDKIARPIKATALKAGAETRSLEVKAEIKDQDPQGQDQGQGHSPRGQGRGLDLPRQR